MATALKITHDSPMLVLDILENIQDMPCPYVASSMTDATVFPVVPSVIPPERSLDADIKTMLADRGLTAREVDAVYQHAATLFLEVSGRTDTDGMTIQLTIADRMCDLFLAARKMR